MKSKSKVIKNYIFNSSYQLLALIVPLVTTPYISRILRADGIGIYSYTYSIVSYFTIFSILGTATYGNKQIGILQDKPEERTKKFLDILTLRMITSGTALVIYVAYVLLFADNKTIALLQAFYILATLTDTSWFFQGMEDFKRVAVRNYLVKILNVAAIFLFIHKHEDLWKYVLSLSFLTLFGSLSILPYLKKYLVKVPNYKPKPFNDINIILQLFIPTMAIQLFEMLDRTMIGVITKEAVENGYYEQAMKIVRMALIVVTAINTVLLPKSSKAYAEGKLDEMKGYLYTSYRFVWFLATPLMCGVIGIASILVPVFFGEGYQPVISVLTFMAFIAIPMGMNSTSGTQFFISTGRQNTYTKYVLIGGAINVALNALLIPFIKSNGAAIASVAGEVFIMSAEFVYISKNKHLEISKVFKMCGKYLIAGGIMLAALLLASSRMQPTVLNLAILIIGGAALYFLLLLIMREHFIMFGIKTAKKFIKNRSGKPTCTKG
ncbi:MAG: flippase [Eubacterium sp.]|nr:flippase [Eubacterium sp.]